MTRRFYVYILANTRGARPVLYVGMTNDLARRVADHREEPTGFVAKYRLTTLVYFESTLHAHVAIARETRIKCWTRAKRIALIESMNPNWRDLMPIGPRGSGARHSPK